MAEGKYILTIIALHSHFDILSNILILLDSHEIKIKLFTSRSFLQHLPQGEYLSRLDITEVSDSRQMATLKKHLPLIQSSNHVLLITVIKNYRFYADLAKSVNLSLLVHNTHYHFSDPRFNLQSRFVSRLLHDHFLIKKYKSALLRYAHSIFFLSKRSLDYAAGLYPGLSAKMKALPYKYQYAAYQPDQNIFQITIPGGVNMHHRDYGFLYDWISKLSPIKPIKIAFLGKSPTASINIFKQKLPLNLKIEILSFPDYISQNCYSDHLKKSNVVLAPVKVKVIFMNYYEFYGLSKNSGAINDAIRFAIPLILPRHYLFDPSVRNLVENYDDQDSFNRIMNKHYLGEPSVKDHHLPDYAFKLVQGALKKDFGFINQP